MRKIVFFILLTGLLGCASKPEILKELYPVEGDNIQITRNEVTQEQENIRITVRFLNQVELTKIAEQNNPYLEGETPLLTTFKIMIENKRKAKIAFRIEDAVLLDGMSSQFNALTYESFKNLYPSTIYQKYEYSFIFDRYYIDSGLTDDYYKRKKVARTLFKGGKIFPDVKVEGIIPFDRISERAKNITLILTDIKLYKEQEAGSSEEIKEDVLEKDLEVRFNFIQKIVRVKD
ncbi:MAG: hypothetical protein PHF84_09000 [bacterium]|nr:hypothetical protein [bacterium]